MYDWKPIVRDLTKELKKEGFSPKSVDDTGELIKTKTWEEVVQAVCAVDEARIFLSHPQSIKSFPWAFIVLGNGPEEIVADYGVNEYMDRAVEAHSEKWEGRPIPKRDSP